MPATVTVGASAGGNEEQVSQTVSGMGIALLLSIVLVYLLMVALYNSYRTPFIIMFAVPVAVVGALGSLALTHQTLNLFSLIGSVLLIGLVTKNGILLVDFANQRRREGLGRVAAMREAARQRFRPIMMTTIAMIAGMIPLAFVLDPGAQAARSLGTVVIGGLASSLLLTLLLVPVVYVAIAGESRHAAGRPPPTTASAPPPNRRSSTPQPASAAPACPWRALARRSERFRENGHGEGSRPCTAAYDVLQCLTRCCVKIRDLLWNAGEVEHLWKSHGVTPDEVEEAVFGCDGEAAACRILRDGDFYVLFGETGDGRLLKIVAEPTLSGCSAAVRGARYECRRTASLSKGDQAMRTPHPKTKRDAADAVLERSHAAALAEAEAAQPVPRGLPPISVRLSAPLLERLDRIAVREHRKRGNLIQHALWEYVRLHDRA